MNLFASFVTLSMLLPAPLLTAQCGAPSVKVPSAGPTKAPIAWATISIHSHNPADTNMSVGEVPNGTGMRGVDLRALLSDAYAFTEPTLRDDEVVGIPGWAKTARYDIVAHVDSDDIAAYKKAIDMSMEETIRHMIHCEATPDMLMLRSLLEERFGLKVHYETRLQRVYELLIDKGGSKLKEAADPVHSGANFSPGVIKGTGIPTQYLAMMLSMPLERSVVDHTALSGRYDFALHLQPRNTPTIPDSSEPDFFTAIREQAGLRLESTKAPVLTLVIDDVHPPTPN